MAGWSTGSAGLSGDDNPVAGNAPTSDNDIESLSQFKRNVIECMRGVHERQYDNGISLTTFTKTNAAGTSNIPVEASGEGFNWPVLDGAENAYAGPQLITQIQNAITDALAAAYGYANKAALLTAAIGASSFTAIAGNSLAQLALIETRKVIEEMRGLILKKSLVNTICDKQIIPQKWDGILFEWFDIGARGNSTVSKAAAWSAAFSNYSTEYGGATFNEYSQYWSSFLIHCRVYPPTYRTGVGIWAKAFKTTNIADSLRDASKHPYDIYKFETILYASGAPTNRNSANYIQDVPSSNNFYPHGADIGVKLRYGTGYSGLTNQQKFEYSSNLIGTMAASKTADEGHFKQLQISNPFPDPVPDDIFIMLDTPTQSEFDTEQKKSSTVSPAAGASVLNYWWQDETGASALQAFGDVQFNVSQWSVYAYQQKDYNYG